MADQPGHGNPTSRRRSRFWIPVIVLAFVVLVFLIFLALDQLAHQQSSSPSSEAGQLITLDVPVSVNRVYWEERPKRVTASTPR